MVANRDPASLRRVIATLAISNGSWSATPGRDVDPVLR
jgi:hypothetical protein